MTTMEIAPETRCAKCDNERREHIEFTDGEFRCPRQGSDPSSWLSPEEPKTTVLEYFSNMTHGTLVYPNSDTDQAYIFVNFHWETEGYKHANIVNPKWANVMQVDVTDENHWETRPNDDGDPKMATMFEQRMATAVVNLRHLHEEKEQKLAAKQVESETLRSDFIKLNEKINEYAEESGMCSDYEERIFGWNNDFETMKLYGRLRDTSVAITVGDSDEALWLTVPARSPEEAVEKVSEMEYRTIIQTLMEQGCGFWGIPMKFRTQNEFYAR